MAEFINFFGELWLQVNENKKKQMLSDATTSAQMHLNACICIIILYIINHIIWNWLKSEVGEVCESESSTIHIWIEKYL